MQVYLRSLTELFEPQRVYRVPTFQRRYVWNQSEQWAPLWDDVEKSAQLCLKRPSVDDGPVDKSDEADHFLGAVVTQHARSSSDVQLRQLIDGQQRLVTLQLLLQAAVQVFGDYGHTAAKRLGRLVRNGEEWAGDDQASVFKVWPTATDEDDFRLAMSDFLSDEKDPNDPLLVAARRFFSRAVRGWISEASDGPEDRIRALERAILNHVKMVVIELGDTDDEHLIFETLNARGTPLTDWDLTKNLILNSAESGSVDLEGLQLERLAEFEDSYWFDEIRTGGAPRARIDMFLNYWMIMRTAQPVEAKPRVTFRAIDAYVKAGGQGITAVAADMWWVGGIFRELDEDDDRSTAYGTFLHRWRAMQVRVLTPILLRVLAEEPSRATLDNCARYLESYLVRRMLCKLTTRGYYDLALGMLRCFDEQRSVPLDQLVREFLLKQETDRYRWPTDEDLRDTFANSRMYGGIPKGRLRFVLEGIEEGMRTAMSDAGPLVRGLSIEHVMPQAWRDKWDDPIATGDDKEDPALRRDRLVHTMGNLTLVTKRLNSSMTNAGLDDKREALTTHSTLFLNKDLLESSADGWDETRIVARSNRLCDAAIQVWPRPEQT